MPSPAHTCITRRSQAWHPVVIGMALCALVMRLISPVPIPVGPEIGLLAVFGEQALCLSGASGTGHPPQAPSPTRDRHDDHDTGHDAGWCCQWHAAGVIILPAAAAAARLRFAASADRLAVAAIGPPALPRGPAQPRAPPTTP